MGPVKHDAQAAIEVAGFRKSYGDLIAVDDISFTVDRGEIFGLLGPNGAGKTTTLECLEGLRRADDGRLSVFGVDPTREPRCGWPGSGRTRPASGRS